MRSGSEASRATCSVAALLEKDLSFSESLKPRRSIRAWTVLSVPWAARDCATVGYSSYYDCEHDALEEKALAPNRSVLHTRAWAVSEPSCLSTSIDLDCSDGCKAVACLPTSGRGPSRETLHGRCCARPDAALL